MVTCLLLAAVLGSSAPAPGSRPTETRTVARGVYRVVLDAGGQMRSLRVGPVEFLQPLPGATSASALRAGGAWVAGRMACRPDGEHRLTFESARVRIRYRFLPDAVELAVRQDVGQDLGWHVRPGQQVVRCVGARLGSTVDPHTVVGQGQVRSRWLTRQGPALVMPDGRWTRVASPAGPVTTYAIWLPAGTEVGLRLRPVAELTGPDALAVDVRADRADFLLSGGASAGFRCRVENLSARAVSVQGAWSVTPLVRTTDVQSDDATQTTLSIPARDVRELPVPLPALEPGVYRAHLDLIDAAGRAVTTDWAFGYAVNRWRPALTREADFEAFWTDTLAELRRDPLEAHVTPVDGNRYLGARLFKVRVRTLGGARCAGWFSVPAGPIPFPALVVLPTGGVEALAPPAPNDNAVLLSLAVHGYDVDLSDAPAHAPWPGWRYQNVGLADRRTCFYRTVYASCVRAVDFLLSRPEVDPNRIAVTGTGEGGGLALVTAALDRRVGLCAPSYSDLCRLDWSVYHTGGGLLTKADKPDGQTDAQFRRTLSYIDVANFAPLVRCPVVAVVGLADRRCPPAGQLAALASVRSPKRILTVPGHRAADHALAARYQRDAVFEFLRRPVPATQDAR